jgi:hypothetical protein
MTPQSRTLHPATAAARIAPLLLQLAALAIAAGGQWLWRHRRQIGAALITTTAATYAAGAWGRQQVVALATDSARRLPAQPVPALAPITATLEAAWGLVDWVTMTRADRARRAQLADYDQRCAICCYTCGPADAAFAIEPIEPGEALLADIASAYGLELSDLQRPVPRRYSAAAAIVRFGDGRELSPYSCSMPWFA